VLRRALLTNARAPQHIAPPVIACVRFGWRIAMFAARTTQNRFETQLTNALNCNAYLSDCAVALVRRHKARAG
jgi:hypothetical protein